MPAIRATYRLQIRGDMDLDRATELLPYLDRLGVSHVYAAPLTRAAPGSQHGYDVCAFDEIDPAIGGEAAFERFAEALRMRGMGLLLDFVPNHMAASVANPWWRSVLESGPTSPHADFFDIDWSARAGATPGKVLVPVLGDQYDAVLERGELRLGVDEGTGLPEVRYWEKRFPLTPESYPLLFGEAAAEPGGQITRERVAAVVERANADRERLHLLLEAQHYRLAHWRTATFSLNYRRFFDINELVGLRVDRPQVFDAAHALVLRLIAEGKIDGLRIDHIDGLRDPVGYLHRLHGATREAAGRDIPVYVEKILGPEEDLRTDWPVQGTTGYEIGNAIGGLFVDPEAADETTETYAELTGAQSDFEAVVEEAKRFVLARLFSGELDALAQRAAWIAAESPETRDVTEGALREALTDLIVAFPVYRSYVVVPPAEGADADLLAAVFDAAAEICPEEAATGLQFLRAMLDVFQQLLEVRGAQLNPARCGLDKRIRRSRRLDRVFR